MHKPKLLFVRLCQLPLQSLIETVELLSNEFDITVYMPDEGFEKLYSNMGDIHYLKFPLMRRKGIIGKVYTLYNMYSFFAQIKRQNSCNNSDLIVLFSQQWAFLGKLILGRKNKYVMQTFTRGVGVSNLKNKIAKYTVKFNIMFFKNVFVPTSYNIKYFDIPKEKAYWNRLSYKSIESSDKSFKKMNLVYLGTLSNRDVHESIIGFIKFYKEYKEKISISYDIIGSGDIESVKKLEDAITQCSDKSVIRYHGRLGDDDVKKIFKYSNIGVAYNKDTDYFEYNIPSKLHEYLLSGMPTISTKNENSKSVVNHQNGVLIESSSKGFYHGMVHIYNNLNKYNSSNIVDSDIQYSKPYVFVNHTIPMYKKLILKKSK